MTSTLLRASAFVALALASCSTGGSTRVVATTTVEMPPSYRFEPKAITVSRGQTVTWHNGDRFTHSVKIEAPKSEMVGVAKPGAELRHTFDAVGTFTYVCTFHPHDMKGTVVVR